MPANLDLQSLIDAGIQIEDPRLHQILSDMNVRLEGIERQLDPLVRQAGELIAVVPPPGQVTGFAVSFTARTVRFQWTAVDTASQYEIREGSDWDTATFRLRTNSLTADIDPLLLGDHTFVIKAINSQGTYSVTRTSVLASVPRIGRPTLKASSIDNNILLNWSTPASVFAIDYYILRRDQSDIGHTPGNFTTYFEVIAGTYTYSIAAVDIAGNEGLEGSIGITLTIPADFVLESTRVSALGSFVTDASFFVYVQTPASLGDVNFRFAVQIGFEAEVTHFYFAAAEVSSTLVNVLLEEGPKLLCCWTVTDFEHHFTNRAWLTPQNQVDAGYPIYIQPANLTGSYEEIYDYGGEFENIIVTITMNANPITSDSVAVLVKMAVSDDGLSYSAYTDGASQFFTSLRFLKFKLEFTGTTDKALVEISDVTITLNVKQEIDSGNVIATAGDVGGTEVIFNKPFKDINSITLTVASLEPVVTIYDFTDIPNPVHFFIYAFDTSGNRITYPVSWKARGVV